MTVELTVTSITVQPEISAAQIVITPTFSSGGSIPAPIISISKNGVNIEPDELKNVDIEVPTKTSDLTNDSDFVSDTDYVHTDNNYTDAAVAEVAKIADKANSSDVYTKSETYSQTEINNKLSAVYKFKGSVLTYDLLPTVHENGDTWNVINGITPELNGMNYAWSDSLGAWDAIGGLVGLATLTENGLLSKEDFAIIRNLSATYAPIIHNHSGENITPETVTTDSVVFNGLDRNGNPITVTRRYNTELGVMESVLPDGTTLQEGLELQFVGKRSGTCRNGYTAQYVGMQGGHVLMKEGVASELNAAPHLFMGIFTMDAGSDDFVKSTWFGDVNEVSTTAYEAQGANTILYVDTEGTGVRGLTTIVPSAGYRKIIAASIKKYSTGASSNGILLVRPTFGMKLSDLDDVDGTDTTIADTDVILKKDTLWKSITWANVKTLLSSVFGALANANTWALLQTFTSGIKTAYVRATTTDNDLYAAQDGTILWHTTKWFTPTGGSTISSNGTTVTLTGSTQFTAAMVGAKISIGTEKRVIATYISTSQVTVDRAFTQNYIGVSDWGVYSKYIDENGAIYDRGGYLIIRPGGVATNETFIGNLLRVYNGSGFRLRDTSFRLPNNFRIQIATTSVGDDTKDTGLRRSANGEWEIDNGITLGDLRDLKLRNLYAGNRLETQLTTATNNTAITSIAVDHTTNFPSTGTILIGGVTSINYTSKTSTSLVFASTVVPTYAVGTSVLVTSAGDYTQVDANGIRLFGAATQHVDLTGDITRTKTTGTGATLNDAENTIDFTNAGTLTDYLFLNYQIQHSWKLGSSIYPHVHFEQANNNTPNFLFEYRWQRQGQAKTTAWTRLKCNTLAFTYTSGTLNQIAYAAAITPPSGYSLSDIVSIRLIRDTANASGLFTGADTYTGTVSVTAVDIHIEVDSIGSNQEYIKY